MPAEPHPALLRLLAEEPFVRLLARTLVAGDGDEVVQRTWLLALRHGGAGVGEPRSWLARIVRNTAANLRRERRRRERHERGAAPPEAAAVPSSAELTQREEQRRALVAAVDALPPPLRAVLLLRYFDGLPPRAIAKRLQLPVATVWNQHRRALELLRERLDAHHGGDRRAWALPLVPFAAGLPAPPAPPLAGTTATTTILGTGAMLMTTTGKAKVAAAFAVLLAAALVWWRIDDGARSAPPPSDGAPGAAPVAATLPTDARSAEAAPPAEARTAVATTAAAAPTTGSLEVHVRHADATPAAGVVVIVAAPLASTRLAQRARTDAEGTVRFDALEPRSWRVYHDRGELPATVEVAAGGRARLDVRLPAGLTLSGVVVDRSGLPVAGALVEVGPGSGSDRDSEVLAVTAADGRFVVRGAPARCVVGARAAGHSGSRRKDVFGKDGNTADVRLQLGPPGGAVDGIVVDERNAPIAGAVVCIGAGFPTGVHSDGESTPPIPALVRTDANGRFRAVGVPPGAQRVQAHAVDRAPWTGSCDVVADVTMPLRIELVPGARLRGVVRSDDGTPVDRAMLAIGDPHAFASYRASTGPDGTFALTALPAGELRITATHGAHGRVETTVVATAGAETACELQLARGIVVRGTVVDENGAAVPSASVQCTSADSPRGSKQTRSAADGTFTVVDCVEGALRLAVRAEGFDETVVAPVEPNAAVRVTLRRLAGGSGRISGTIVDADGKPVANARVAALGRSPGPTGRGMEASGGDGRFTCGPLAPGPYRLLVMSGEHPPLRGEPLELAADQQLDVGRLVLATGGRVRVQIAGGEDGVQLAVADAQDRDAASMHTGGDVRTTKPIAPGDYWLKVAGERCAAQSLPVTVRAGEVTDIAVTVAPGVRQRVVVAATAVVPSSTWMRVAVLRDDRSVATKALQPSAERDGELAFCLAPGTYTVRATAGDRELARAAFTVGEQEGAPLHLTLR